MKKIAPFLILIFLFMSSQVGVAQVRPELSKPYLMAPILMDGKVLTDAWIFPRATDSEFSIEATAILSATKLHLKDELFSRLQARVRNQNILTFEDLSAVGYTIRFDEASLEVLLDLPAKYRKSRDLDLNYVEIDNKKYLRPGSHSGYLNFRAQQSWQYGDNENGSRRGFSGNLEFVENIQGLVLESSANFQEDAVHTWTRLDTRLRFDDEESMVRYTLGDLNPKTVGFQVTPSLGGLSVAREFAIQPYKTLTALSSTEIVIKRSSIVDVYVNGMLISQLRLSPGVFNIRDFPLATGQSSVRIKVKDDLGQEDFYDFSMLYESSLLGRGVQEFSYSLGMPWQVSGADRRYDNEYLLTSVFHRVGLTDNFTMGYNFQNFSHQNLFGGEASGVTNWGYLSAHIAGTANGFGERWTYRSLDKMLGRQIPFYLMLEVKNQDPQFKPVVGTHDIAPSSPQNILRQYDAQVNYRLDSSWLFGLGAGQTEFLNQRNQTIYRANLMVPMNNNLRVEFGVNRILQDTVEDRILVSLFWNETQGLHSVSAYHDSLDKITTLTVNRNNRYQYDDYRWNASLQGNDDRKSGTMTGEYFTQPASFRLDQMAFDQSGNRTNLTTLGVNTGIAWVGKDWAWTQPISDSFLLVKAENLEEGQVLMINPIGDRGQAQLGPRKTVVLREQSAYYRNSLNIDATTLPMGYLIDREFYDTQLTYRSGLLLNLNISKKVMVKGQLLLRNGEALGYIAGDIFDSSGNLIDNTFFTNKEGRFVVEGLSPGQYRVKTEKSNLNSFMIEIPTTARELLTLDPIQVESQENGL